MNKENVAFCGLRYGQTKYQAEQTKKYIEENSLTEIKITIFDSESKQKLDKIKEYCKTQTKGMPQNGCKSRLNKILSIIDGSD